MIVSTGGLELRAMVAVRVPVRALKFTAESWRTREVA